MRLPIVAYVGKVRRTFLLSGRGGLRGYDLSKLKEDDDEQLSGAGEIQGRLVLRFSWESASGSVCRGYWI